MGRVLVIISVQTQSSYVRLSKFRLQAQSNLRKAHSFCSGKMIRPHVPESKKLVLFDQAYGRLRRENKTKHTHTHKPHPLPPKKNTIKFMLFLTTVWNESGQSPPLNLSRGLGQVCTCSYVICLLVTWMDHCSMIAAPNAKINHTLTNLLLYRLLLFNFMQSSVWYVIQVFLFELFLRVSPSPQTVKSLFLFSH